MHTTSMTQWDDKDSVLASAQLRRDKEVVLAAGQKSGLALKFADADLRADKEVVLVAVRQIGEAIRFAGEKLRGSKEVLDAVLNRHYNIIFESPLTLSQIKQAVGEDPAEGFRTRYEVYQDGAGYKC